MSVVATCVVAMFIQGAESAPVSESLSSTDRRRLGDILTRLEDTLADLTTFLKSESTSSTAGNVELSKELPSLVDEYRHSQLYGKSEADDSSELSSSDLSLKDVLRYLVQLKQHSKHGPSAAKRDHDIPFPIDGTFNYNFRD